jgi:hypothetical protein
LTLAWPSGSKRSGSHHVGVWRPARYGDHSTNVPFGIVYPPIVTSVAVGGADT